MNHDIIITVLIKYRHWQETFAKKKTELCMSHAPVCDILRAYQVGLPSVGTDTFILMATEQSGR